MTLEQLIKDFEAESSPEKSLRQGIDFMRTSLSQEGAPRFKDFWQVRQLCLPLFKQSLSPSVRTQFWKEFAELSSEARRLREILEEKATFAFEQLELAIQALEEEIKKEQESIAKLSFDDLTQGSKFLASKAALYRSLDREFYLYDVLAGRVRSLRDEMVKAEMRLRHKNRLFDRLKVAGDHIFSRRKEVAQSLSQEFDSDVKRYTSTYFESETSKEIPPFILKEEIKVLQFIGKHRAIALAVFRESREKLSYCWDQLKEREKEKKKEFSEKRQQQEIERKKREEEQQARKEKEDKRKTEFQTAKKALQQIIEEIDQINPAELVEKIKEKREQCAALSLLPFEKQELAHLFEALDEQLCDKKEKVLLSSTELEALKELEIQLEERKKQREESKAQLENCRKTLGGSGLDFHKAMHYRELMQKEKERFAKIETAIEDLEERIENIR